MDEKSYLYVNVTGELCYKSSFWGHEVIINGANERDDVFYFTGITKYK